LAEALLADGCMKEALEACEEALEFAHQTGGLCNEAETRRIRALALHALADPRVESELELAMQIAEAGEARLLELRAALPYFSVCGTTGKSSDARRRVQRLIEWFGPGAYPILAEARTALSEAVRT